MDNSGFHGTKVWKILGKIHVESIILSHSCLFGCVESLILSVSLH